MVGQILCAEMLFNGYLASFLAFVLKWIECVTIGNDFRFILVARHGNIVTKHLKKGFVSISIFLFRLTCEDIFTVDVSYNMQEWKRQKREVIII